MTMDTLIKKAIAKQPTIKPVNRNSLPTVQCVGAVNDYNFRVTLVSGVEAFGKPEQYKEFLEKYMSYLESRQ